MIGNKNNIASIICGAPCGIEYKEHVTGLVIAADGGLDNALSAGIIPDIAAGDFDSAKANVPSGVECVRVKPEKDDTDTILAADIASERGCKELRFFCALGGRYDHSFANIQMLYGLHRRGITARIYGNKAVLYFLSDRAVIERYKGYLSVFSYTGNAVVSLRGVKYPLERGELNSGYPLGVSNEITADSAEITVHSGTVLIVEQRSDGG